MRPPKLIKPYVKTFARQILKKGSGVVDLHYISCNPSMGVPENECFPIVSEKVNKEGGRAIIGWTIWERPKLFIEAEFHMVWESPQGELQDIVPRSLPIPRILFLVDHHRHYQERQVDNVRKPLCKDKDVTELLRLFQRTHELLNEGDLASQHGLVKAPPEYFQVMAQIAQISLRLDRCYGPWMPEGI